MRRRARKPSQYRARKKPRRCTSISVVPISVWTRHQLDRLRYVLIHVRFAPRRGPRDVTGGFHTFDSFVTRPQPRMYARESLIIDIIRCKKSYFQPRVSSDRRSISAASVDRIDPLETLELTIRAAETNYTASGFCIALSSGSSFQSRHGIGTM